MRRSLILMTTVILVWGMWDRWWHLAGMAVCFIGYHMLEASNFKGVMKDAKQLDNDLVRHMAEVDQLHADIREHVVVMCSSCYRLFDSPTQCEEHMCGT